MLSISWSIFPEATAYKAISLLLISMLAGFIGIRFSLDEILNILAATLGALAILSAGLALLLPGWGTMTNPPYGGAWQGLFWHRNYLGTIMSLGMLVFLIRLLTVQKMIWSYLLNGIFFTLCGALVFLSRSATGIILGAFLTGTTLIAFAWIKTHHRLNKKTYFILAGLAAVAVVAILINLNSIFGLLGRNTSLTGRIPLWDYLLKEYISQRPLFGYGFGAFWSFEAVRTGVQGIVGWGYPILIGDNGWIDLLLHIGWIGAIIFTAILVYIGWHSICFAIQERTIISFLSILVLVFALVGNISLSLFLELETFVWVVLICTFFSITRKKQSRSIYN